MNYHLRQFDALPTTVGGQVADPQAALQRTFKISMIALAVLIFGVFGCLAVVHITGAVVAHGEVAVGSKIKKLSHPTGGVVAQIYVKDGDHVKLGAPLIKFDSTVSGASADLSGKSVDQLLAHRARLIAERDGTPLSFPASLTSRLDESPRAAIAEATQLYQLRQRARIGQQTQLRERIRQMEAQIGGYQEQIAANAEQNALIKPELDGTRKLWEKKLVTLSRVNALERSAIDLQAAGASLRSNVAETRAHIAEVRQQLMQVDQDARSEAGASLTELETKLSDQQLRRVTTADTFDRSVIRAPQAGVIDKLAYNTIGGVIPPGETILEIVPNADAFVVEARVSPSDADEVRVDQAATLRFSALNQQTTPQVQGVVRYVSASSTVDEHTGVSYYIVRVSVADKDLKKLGNVKLAPGMPVEAFIQTGNRSFLSYLVKPLHDQFSRAFRQD